MCERAMIEPMRSAVEFALLFGGLGMVALGIALGNRPHHKGTEAAIFIMIFVGIACIEFGFMMALFDILFGGYD